MNRESDDMDIQVALATLADGTLPDQQREAVQARVAASPELAAELEDQRRAVLLIRSLDAVEAPSLLRRSIELAASGEAATAGASRRPRLAPSSARRWPLRPAAALALGAATLAVALVLALTLGGSSSSPTVLQASRAGLLTPTQPAPAESRRNHHQLTISAAGITYPYWGGTPGWSTTGARTDTIGGRTVTTVFYSRPHQRRIGYSIVSGAALALPTGSAAVHRGGLSFRILRHANPTIVTWRQAGHTCILTAHGVSGRTLMRLAAWMRA